MDGTGAFIYFNVRPSSILYCRLLCILITVIASSRFWWWVFDWSNFSKIQAQNNSICCAKPLTPALLVAPCQVWQSQTAPQYRTQLKYLLEPVLPKTSSCSVLVNKQRYNKWEHHEKLLPLTFGFASYATYFSGPSSLTSTLFMMYFNIINAGKQFFRIVFSAAKSYEQTSKITTNYAEQHF